MEGKSVARLRKKSVVRTRTHSRNTLRIWPSISMDCAQQRRPDPTLMMLPRESIERRNTLVSAYRGWKNRTPILFVCSEQGHCVAATMINPSYNPRGDTWGENVYFGRVSNFATVFAAFLERNNLAPLPTPHSEQRFREFTVDPLVWESRIGDFHSEADYPVLLATLPRPDRGYSIETVETLYTFYVIRRMASANPFMKHMQFDIGTDNDLTRKVRSVKKLGVWSV